MCKRMIALVIALAIAASLMTACGSSGKEPQQTNPVQNVPAQTTLPQSEPTQGGTLTDLPDGFKKNGAFVVTREQMATMLNLALSDTDMFIGFDGISDGTAMFSVVTRDNFDDLGINAYATVSGEGQPIENLCFYIATDCEDESLGLFTELTCIACSVADPTLSLSDAAGLLSEAEEMQREDGSTVRIAEHGDFQFIMAFTENYIMFYVV